MTRETQYSRPNARELYERLKETKSHTGKRFEVTDWNRDVIFALCLYFAEDPKFESQYGGSLKKGIYLQGPQGTGKSHLMNAFSLNPHCSYVNITCKQVAEHYAQTNPTWQRNGVEALTYYSSSHSPSSDIRDVYKQEKFGFCFGDLGNEAIRKHYGNETNVMEHVIFQRYENGVAFNQTHFTTNLNNDELTATYGIRVSDRLNEMCNIFILDGPSWRK